MFQHTAARRRLGGTQARGANPTPFQHTAARRRLGTLYQAKTSLWRCFNTQPPEGGWTVFVCMVFTLFSFNTQPPEGGWIIILLFSPLSNRFQHTAARRRLGNGSTYMLFKTRCFNTQPPEGGWENQAVKSLRSISFNTQPPEGGWMSLEELYNAWYVSTHSRPKAAGTTGQPGEVHPPRFNTQPPEGGWRSFTNGAYTITCFNTQPPEGGWLKPRTTPRPAPMFQHTAARRRLGNNGMVFRQV